MESVRLLDPTFQFESRRVAVDQLPGFDLPNELQNTLAHMAAVEGDTTKLLKATDGALHVAGDGFDALTLALVGEEDKGLDDLLAQAEALELALCGAEDKGLDDLLTQAEALELALCGAEDKGLDDILAAVVNQPTEATWEGWIETFVDIKTAVESIDTVLTDVWLAETHKISVDTVY